MLREQESGERTADVCRRHGVRSASLCTWKAKHGGLDVSEARRLKGLEDESGRLKKLLAQAMLDEAVLRGVAGKEVARPAAKRAAVAHACAEHGVSQRRACALLGGERFSVRGIACRDDDAELRDALRATAARRRRFGHLLPGRASRSDVPRGRASTSCWNGRAGR